jgi:hypothetical protein
MGLGGNLQGLVALYVFGVVYCYYGFGYAFVLPNFKQKMEREKYYEKESFSDIGNRWFDFNHDGLR